MRDVPDAEVRRRKVFAAKTPEELKRVYDEWAERYDEDLEGRLGFVGPKRAAQVCAEYVPKKARILDAGAGTGLVGAALNKLGFFALDALDASPDMLAEAHKKGVYRNHLERFLGPRVDIESQSYDAVISVGTLTSGHVEPEALSELIRITRPGGWIIFTLIPEFGEQSGYFDEMSRLERLAAWRKLACTESFAMFANGPERSQYNIWVYQVL